MRSCLNQEDVQYEALTFVPHHLPPLRTIVMMDSVRSLGKLASLITDVGFPQQGESAVI